MRVRLHRRAGLALAGAALVAISACASRQPDRRSDVSGSLRVTESDFRIKAPKQVRAGALHVSIRNKGPDDHEFIVVRLGDKKLPLRPDGLTVDEDAIENATAGALEPARPGVHQLSVRLQPGRYELLCNMYGHYAGGMHTKLDVRS